MHEPTPPDRRAAALRFQAERLIHDAAAWGYDIRLDTMGSAEEPHVIELTPHPEPTALPPAP